MPSSTLPVISVLWLLPVSWAVHDGEEILTIEPWSRRWTRHLDSRDEPASVQTRLVGVLATTRRRYSIAVGLVGCLVVGATVAGTYDTAGIGRVVYMTILGGYFLHAFVHLGQSALLRGYTPGVLSAVFVVIPTASYLYWRLFATGYVDCELAVVTGLVGMLSFVPIVVGANWFAGRLDVWFE